ncbi:phage tail protein [Pedobacter nutrimenti]|jgi:phage tail-like protein|uniref:Phage tail-like protein n=1 Tax=Pedobacter nutrimenti TaxID=1241337 RepID=A0A318UG69_9SPHI|nr:phage tail protein [Pedobacter nutrimenti]PYF75133.1 phage tail-like protein [Pedobacter nutrimenti]|eukprot:gene10505-12227_t
MADDGSKQSTATYALVKFAFQVKWDDKEFVFSEVTGLTAEAQVIEYRGGSSKTNSTVKMPGLLKYGNVTLKKGMFKDDKAMWEKFKALNMNTIKRATILISLLDEAKEVVMSWTLLNAFPVKLTVTDMKSDANEVALESIELAHEGLSLTK